MENILSQKWEKAFVFFKHEEEARGPEFTLLFHKFVVDRQKKKLKKRKGCRSK
jgi:hypothetical protein